MKFLVIALCVGTAMARPDGAGGHHHDHAAATAPAAPSSGYQEPAAGYSAPSAGYEQPAYDAGAGYSAPSAGGYDASYDTGYTAPESYAPYAAAEAGPFLGFGLGWVFVPIVIVLGIFLLFPQTTVVPVTNGRRKRGAEEEVSGNSLVERIQDITLAVLESEECMERVACEVGGLVADAGISKKIFTTAEAFVPSKYTKMMKTFNSGKDCRKIKCGSF